ncbi:MAG TPA: GntG family PLP-dependent aldolase [Acidobacteriota bacterium]|nr:GntG family PLP-dependent aldolase [Acidobacteriota bacterium]
MKLIDLRSDTVTRPSAEMRQAIAAAEVGDDVLGDDPTAIELERYVADLFGCEASLFVPSGTMGNQICLKAISRPGWEMLCDRECHVINYEVAGPVVHSGLLVNLLTTEHGMITAEMVRRHVRPRNIHAPETRIVELENTHNRHSGTILPQEEILRVREVCDEFGLLLHLDGARIWNAHAATGLSLPELIRPFDSVSVCLSKGLGAPIGSMIVGSAEFIDRCRRLRKLFGGGMRQVGLIAAAGLYAVKNNIKRLTEDHTNARLLAEQLNNLQPFEVDLNRVQTNIVVANLNGEHTAESVLAGLREVNVLAVPFGPKKIRMVTHLDVTRADCQEALERIGKLFA